MKDKRNFWLINLKKTIDQSYDTWNGSRHYQITPLFFEMKSKCQSQYPHNLIYRINKPTSQSNSYAVHNCLSHDTWRNGNCQITILPNHIFIVVLALSKKWYLLERMPFSNKIFYFFFLLIRHKAKFVKHPVRINFTALAN